MTRTSTQTLFYRILSGLTLLCLVAATPALAAPRNTGARSAKPTAAQTESAADDAPATQTDIIGSKEAPGVSNIVPWENKTTPIPQKEVTTSILQETLQPLDRDVLLRQIQLQQTLTKE